MIGFTMDALKCRSEMKMIHRDQSCHIGRNGICSDIIFVCDQIVDITFKALY